MHKNNKTLLLNFAIAAAMAAPTAFAQDAGANAGVQATPAVAATPAVPPAPIPPEQDARNPQDLTAATAAESATPARKNWSELDADANGSLSVAEAASMPQLAQVFAKADADADGELTQDEYKAWLAANGKPEDKR